MFRPLPRGRLILLLCVVPAAAALSPLGLRLLQPELKALGTYASGRKIILLEKIESRGIFYESYEGKAYEAWYDSGEKCDDSKEKRDCYTPTRRRFDFSVRPENAVTVNFLRKNEGRELLIEYQIHRVEAAALESSFEVLKAYAREDAPPTNMQRRLVNPDKSGSRHFNVYGRILSLEYRGTVIGTFEGLYYDMRKRKVHPFSITWPRMASMARDTMFFVKPIHFGITDAIITGARASSYDIYEINFDEESGGVDLPKPKKEEPKGDGPKR